MKAANWIFILIGAGLLMSARRLSSYKNVLISFLPSVESFTPLPYWDFKQWSWGYGTKVPNSISNENIKPAGQITRAQAMADMLAHIETDRKYLARLITTGLNSNQWAALLSFSYNLGPGNADNLVNNINANNNEALKDQWLQYVNAGGVPMENLINRRQKEWQLWQT